MGQKLTQHAHFNGCCLELRAIHIPVGSPVELPSGTPAFHPSDGFVKFGQVDACRRGDHVFEDFSDRCVVHSRNITRRPTQRMKEIHQRARVNTGIIQGKQMQLKDLDGRNFCRHGLMISMLWLVLFLHAGPRKRTAAEILVEAKLSAKAILELTPGRSSSPRSREGKSAGPRSVPFRLRLETALGCAGRGRS